MKHTGEIPLSRLSKDEVEERDKQSLSYHYYKPIAGEEYQGQKIKRKHYCEKCGAEGSLAPQYFWNGRGCQKCSSSRGQDQQFNTEEVQKRDASSLASESYPPDYGQLYINQYQKRQHTCLECGHKGELVVKSFWSGTGCPTCGAKKGSENKIKNAAIHVSEKDKKAKAYETYPPISEYQGVSIHRQHQCKACEYIGEMKPDNFWHNGRGCPVCGIKLGSGNKRKNMKMQAPDRDSKAKHYESYSPISEYTGSFEHRAHACKVCGHEGKMTPNNFWRGRGCPVCADSGFDKTAPATLYYLRITTRNHLHLYKIGITNRTVKERYNNSDLSLITVVQEWSFEKGIDAHMKEQEILNLHCESIYKGEQVLQSGNSEIFISDILKLDIQEK